MEKEFDNHCYYDDDNGRIIGMTTRLGNNKSIYTATAYNIKLEEPLGTYVSLEYAKKAIELFWEIQERTLLEHR
jgi:hypothetical protein